MLARDAIAREEDASDEDEEALATQARLEKLSVGMYIATEFFASSVF
jgi:hypothetical protein